MLKEKPSILIVDDNTSILRTTARILVKAGYNVETAHTGKEASEKFTTKKFDVALIDVSLGETKGTDLLPQLERGTPTTFRIVFTGTPMSEGAFNEAKNSAYVLLLKPVKPETLLGILHDELERRKNLANAN